MRKVQPSDPRVWDAMLDASRLGRYYLALANRWQRYHLALSLSSILGAIAAATVLLSPLGGNWDDVLGAGLFFVAAVATTVMVVYDFSGRAQKARSVAEEMNSIEVEHRRIYLHGADGELLRMLEDRLDVANRNDLPIDYDLNDKSNCEAAEVLDSFYERPTADSQTRQT